MDFLKPFKKVGISEFWLLVIIPFIILGFFVSKSPDTAGGIFGWIVFFLPVIIPIVLTILFWNMWIGYIRGLTISKEKHILLEIKLPREIEKSPRAMEMVFDGLHTGSDGTWYMQWWKGTIRPWWSLEITSFEGRIHFYIWTRAFYKDHVEAQLYAQYPEIEVYEVEDYTRGVSFDYNHMALWGCDFKLTKADPYPIKTYIDYELDKDPRTEYKIDPSSNLFEYLSTIGPGEQVWMQILMRMNKDTRKKSGWFGGTEARWVNDAKDEIDKIIKDATPEIDGPDGTKRPGIPNLTPGQTDAIKAIERSMGKNGFDVGIRGIYLTEKESFKPMRIAGLAGAFKQYGSGGLNGFAPTRWMTVFDYPWQDFRQIRQNRARSGIIDAYKKRSWFHPPYKTDHYVLTSEELATIYHFPGGDVRAPGISRIPSTRGGPPTNLPI